MNANMQYKVLTRWSGSGGTLGVHCCYDRGSLAQCLRQAREYKRQLGHGVFEVTLWSPLGHALPVRTPAATRYVRQFLGLPPEDDSNGGEIADNPYLLTGDALARAVASRIAGRR